MNFCTSIKSYVPVFSLLLTNMIVVAQDFIPDFDYQIAVNGFMLSENAAWLDEFEGEKVSVAQVYTFKSGGGFTNYYESDNSYEYGALSESYQKLNNKVTVYGKIDYSYFSGENMSGSCFINPYNNAFNIVEYTDNTAGEKIKETYLIAGGFSTKLSHNLLLGAKADYENVSYFKTRDLRHTNDLMDLNFYTGLAYKFTNYQIGINYAYHRSVESIKFKTYGNTDEQYNCLIDYGGFFGYVERYDAISDGITRGTSEKPYYNQEHGLSLQINLFSKNKVSFFNQLSLKTGDGYYGRKGSTTIVYTEHLSNRYIYKGIITMKNPRFLHQLNLYCNYFTMDNILNDPSESNDSGNGTVITYGIAHKISHKSRLELSANYSGNLLYKDGKIRWHFDANLSYNTNYLKSIYYEVLTYRKQQINQITGTISGYRNFYSSNKAYRIIVGAGYGTGSGYAYKDTYYTVESDSDVVTMNDYTNSEFEFFTANRLKANLGFRYSQLANSSTNKVYTEITYDVIKSFGNQYVGSYYGSASIVLGYQF